MRDAIQCERRATAAAVVRLAPDVPERLHDACGVLLASLSDGRWRSVPLARAHFEGAGFLRELDRVAVRDAVDALERRGLLEVQRGAAGQGCTRARLTAPVGSFELEARSLRCRVVFRDGEKRPSTPVLEADDRREAAAVNSDLCGIFDAMQRHTITLARADAIDLADALRGSVRTAAHDADREHPYRMDGGPGSILPGRARGPDSEADLNNVDAMLATAGDPIDVRPWVSPVAVYNLGSVRLGGRVYRLAPQGWPSHFRGRLRIDGEPVMELDHPALHPRLLCAAIGIDTIAGDFYGALAGTLPRAAVKVATNTLWCADAIPQALGVIAQAMRDHEVARPRLAALAFVRHFADVYAALVPFVGCAAGRTLQNVDGAMARDVMLALADVGCIGVHDSFLVPAHAAERLREAMTSAFDRRVAWGRERLLACAGPWTAGSLIDAIDRELDGHERPRLAKEDRAGALV